MNSQLSSRVKAVKPSPTLAVIVGVGVNPDGRDEAWRAVLSSPVQLGDVNLDGQVDGLDVDPFVDVLLDSSYQVEADMNQDHLVNGLDVDPFVAAVVGGGLQAVPEPSSLILLGLGLGTLAVVTPSRRRGRH